MGAVMSLRAWREVAYDGAVGRIGVAGAAVVAASEIVVGMGDGLAVPTDFAIAVGDRLQMQGDGASGRIRQVGTAAVDGAAVVKGHLSAPQNGRHFHHLCAAAVELLF